MGSEHMDVEISMSAFIKEQVSVEFVEELFGLIAIIASGDKLIVERFKSIYGNTWASTSYDYALSDLKTQMYKSRNNHVLEVGFTKLADELRAEGKATVPTPKEILQHVSKLNRTQTFKKTYTFVEELGHGQTGRVDKVVYRNGSFERHFARKTCETIADLKRFEREIKTLAELNHSGIVSIVDAEFTPGNAWYVMDLIEGQRLCDYHGTFWEKHEIISNLFEAVAYLHKKKIIHRDLKPENIMIRESDGRPVIVDFGSSYSRLYSTLTTKNVGQTMGYCGPEIQSDPNSSRLPQNDIYACGVIAYEFLTGNKPNPSLDYIPIAHAGVGSHVLENLDGVIQKGISYRVANRFRSIEEMGIEWKKLTSMSLDLVQRIYSGTDTWKRAVRIEFGTSRDQISVKIPEMLLSQLITDYTNEKIPLSDVITTRFTFFEQGFNYHLSHGLLFHPDGSEPFAIDKEWIFDAINTKANDFFDGMINDEVNWEGLRPEADLVQHQDVSWTDPSDLGRSFVSLQGTKKRSNENRIRSFSDDVPF